jgi:Tfp pilus assembly protein PilN
MNEAGTIVRDHWPWLLAGVLVLVVIVMLAVVGLIFFVRWAVHIEFTALTSTLHKDISDINAKLALIAKTEWSDVALARKFADIDSVMGDNQHRLNDVDDSIRALEDEDAGLRKSRDDHEERMKVLEAWKNKVSDMTIIRGGF